MVSKKKSSVLSDCFLMGYNNVNAVMQVIYPKNSPSESKVYRLLNYFGIKRNPSKFEVSLLEILAYLELPVSYLILLYRFLYLLLIKPWHRESELKNQYCLLGVTKEKTAYDNLMKNSDICDYILLKIPFVKYGRNNVHSINIISGLRLSEIAKSFCWTIAFVTKNILKYGKNDIFFRFYSFFEYCLAYFFLIKLDASNNLVFVSTYDRWSYLVDNCNRNLIWVQHGVLSEKMAFPKLHNITEAYYISPTQVDIVDKILFDCKPIVRFQKSIQISPRDSSVNDGKKVVLLICNAFYFDIEKYLVSNLDLKRIHLVLKLNPKHEFDLYYSLKEQYDISLITNQVFPDVDIVISYISTLAQSYEDLGYRVVYYSDPPDGIKVLEIVNSII